MHGGVSVSLISLATTGHCRTCVECVWCHWAASWTGTGRPAVPGTAPAPATAAATQFLP